MQGWHTATATWQEGNLNISTQKARTKQKWVLLVEIPVLCCSSMMNWLDIIWGFPKMVVPNNHLFVLLKMIILGCEMGVPPFKETPISKIPGYHVWNVPMSQSPPLCCSANCIHVPGTQLSLSVRLPRRLKSKGSLYMPNTYKAYKMGP